MIRSVRIQATDEAEDDPSDELEARGVVGVPGAADVGPALPPDEAAEPGGLVLGLGARGGGEEEREEEEEGGAGQCRRHDGLRRAAAEAEQICGGVGWVWLALVSLWLVVVVFDFILGRGVGIGWAGVAAQTSCYSEQAIRTC